MRIARWIENMCRDLSNRDIHGKANLIGRGVSCSSYPVLTWCFKRRVRYLTVGTPLLSAYHHLTPPPASTLSLPFLQKREFNMDGSYQYQPLPRNTILSYRTFTLGPAADFAAAIKGSLNICSVTCSDSEGPCFTQFEGLSYTWGDATVTGTIEFENGSYLPIAANLESFLRYRRNPEESIALWIDAICINQSDIEEKNYQVQAMGRIFTLACPLTVWLGAPSDDSNLAMQALRRFSLDMPFAKLSCSSEDAKAIKALLSRPWWSRAWIVQELALGGAGSRHNKVAVRCGFERLQWLRFVLACARMYANSLNKRQRFPDVEHVLRLDALTTRDAEQFIGIGQPYSSRLLRQLADYRHCQATNPKDKVYAMLGLWADALAIDEQPDGSETDNRTSSAYDLAPRVDYSHSTRDVYLEFATWMLLNTQSLQVLHHCQPLVLGSVTGEPILPTWAPDWSQAQVQTRLPCVAQRYGTSIPWWSVPVRSEDDARQKWNYVHDNQVSRVQRAKEIVQPVSSGSNYVPEWAIDTLDPEGTKNYESLFKEFQNRSDVLFVFPDESGRALGDESEDLWADISRTQDYNERTLQRQLLTQYLNPSIPFQDKCSASADSAAQLRLEGNVLYVEGIFCDVIEDVHDAFPGSLGSEWVNSTLLMVQIGRCKQDVMSRSFRCDPYVSEVAKLMAFWETMFAGQQTVDPGSALAWLPLIPVEWQWTVPSLTVLESGRLEHAEIRCMVEEFGKLYMDLDANDETHRIEGFDGDLARDENLLDANWTPSDRLDYQLRFEELGRIWVSQPYDLYHRPFQLPYVLPDPFWDSRCLHDKDALKASQESRHRTVIESLDGPTREFRRDIRRFMSEKIRRQPAREPRSLADTHLIKYALGRRFFVTRDGHFGLAPPNAQKGDRVVVLFGTETPFILRRVDSGFQVVGESYVHGYMNGEVIEKMQRGMIQAENIGLV